VKVLCDPIVLCRLMLGRVILSITQLEVLVVLLTVLPYLTLVYYTTGMANLKICVDCLVVIKLFPISDNSCYCQYNLWWQ